MNSFFISIQFVIDNQLIAYLFFTLKLYLHSKCFVILNNTQDCFFTIFIVLILMFILFNSSSLLFILIFYWQLLTYHSFMLNTCFISLKLCFSFYNNLKHLLLSFLLTQLIAHELIEFLLIFNQNPFIFITTIFDIILFSIIFYEGYLQLSTTCLFFGYVKVFNVLFFKFYDLIINFFEKMFLTIYYFFQIKYYDNFFSLAILAYKLNFCLQRVLLIYFSFMLNILLNNFIFFVQAGEIKINF